MPHNCIFTMTTTPDPKIHCLFEPGTDVRFNYERYEKEKDEVDAISTEKCQLYTLDTYLTVTTVDGEDDGEPLTSSHDISWTQYVYGVIEILDVYIYYNYYGFDENDRGTVALNLDLNCRGRVKSYQIDDSNSSEYCGDQTQLIFGVGAEFSHNSEIGIKYFDAEYPMTSNSKFVFRNYDTGELVAEGGVERKTTGKVCKLQPEQSIDINTIVPLLSGIEVKGSVEFPSMPENCIEIWRYIQGAPLPTQMKVKQLCSEEGCPPPKYTVDCEPCCPSGLIEVKCGDSVCCYNKQGEAVKQCP